VGQLDRSPADIQTIFQARDVTYGLFSVFFVVCITFAIPTNTGEDPLVKREEAAVEQVTTWILRQLREATECGKKTAPTISTLLETLESSLGPQTRREDDPNRVWDTKKKEIKTLKELYVNWEPICKWQGEERRLYDGQDKDDTFS
jgi:hypothetical protein